MTSPSRLQFGIAPLDDYLGGGLLPGTLTVVAGATGIGKTQLGLHFANRGASQEGRRGVIFDMSARGDSQNHAGYARSLFDWDLRYAPAAPEQLDPERIWQVPAACLPCGEWPKPATAHSDIGPAEYLHLFDHAGRRVTRDDLDFDHWQAWKNELARKLGVCIHFFYSAFVGGVRRAVVDGVEPVERPSRSIQFDLFEYIYHQILRKDADWVARDLFRERFRSNHGQVEAHLYDPKQVACLLLYTTRGVMLEDLIGRPLDQGDLFSNANTIVLMGKIREGSRLGRALCIAKHRGSYCHDQVAPFWIDSCGIQMDGGPAGRQDGGETA